MMTAAPAAGGGVHAFRRKTKKGGGRDPTLPG